eukprot:SM000173S03004  [mRNA]  locus=s173:86222:87612:+ [translate_table: standard]
MADLLHALRRACQYHTGYPKQRLDTAVYNFQSERQFVDLLQQGSPVVVAFTLRCAHTRVLDQALEDAAAEWHPHVRFMRVECPKYPGFCIARERTDYPFVEIFLSSQEKAERLQEGPASISKYQVNVMPFTYDVSAYGFREFLKKHGIGGGGGTS